MNGEKAKKLYYELNAIIVIQRDVANRLADIQSALVDEVPLSDLKPGNFVYVTGGPNTGANGSLNFIDNDGQRALVDFGGGRKGGLTWVDLNWLRK